MTCLNVPCTYHKMLPSVKKMNQMRCNSHLTMDQAEIVGCGNPSMDSDNLQAGNVWDDEFNQSMSELGNKHLRGDYCAYICKETEMLSP